MGGGKISFLDKKVDGKMRPNRVSAHFELCLRNFLIVYNPKFILVLLLLIMTQIRNLLFKNLYIIDFRISSQVLESKYFIEERPLLSQNFSIVIPFSPLKWRIFIFLKFVQFSGQFKRSHPVYVSGKTKSLQKLSVIGYLSHFFKN